MKKADIGIDKCAIMALAANYQIGRQRFLAAVSSRNECTVSRQEPLGRAKIEQMFGFWAGRFHGTLLCVHGTLLHVYVLRPDLVRRERGDTMARPLEFEYVIECQDPEAEREKLLSTPASPRAMEILAEADVLHCEQRNATHATEDATEPSQ